MSLKPLKNVIESWTKSWILRPTAGNQFLHESLTFGGNIRHFSLAMLANNANGESDLEQTAHSNKALAEIRIVFAENRSLAWWIGFDGDHRRSCGLQGSFDRTFSQQRLFNCTNNVFLTGPVLLDGYPESKQPSGM